MSEKLKKIFKIFIWGYVIASIISFAIVYYCFSDNTNWMSFLGSFLGGILGGLATLIAIYFTIITLKQDVMPLIIPMRTVIYGYYKKGYGVYVTSENIADDSQMDSEYNLGYEFNPFNPAFMKFANVGKDSALNIQVEWGSPFDSELYDILLGYGIPHEHFDENFDTGKRVVLYTDYMLPIKNEPENYKVQMSMELVDLFIYTMKIFLGVYKEMAIDEKTEMEFGNNFIKKKHKFTTVKIKYDDLNGNHTEQEFDVYCRIQTMFGSYNGGYDKLQIELSTSKIVN